MLGDFSLGSRVLADDEPPYLVGETMLSFARSGLPPAFVAAAVESRGEIWLGRNKRSVLLLRSPGEVDKTSCANLNKNIYIKTCKTKIKVHPINDVFVNQKFMVCLVIQIHNIYIVIIYSIGSCISVLSVQQFMVKKSSTVTSYIPRSR